MVYNWAKNSQTEDFYIENLNKEMFRSNFGCLGAIPKFLARVDKIKFLVVKDSNKELVFSISHHHHHHHNLFPPLLTLVGKFAGINPFNPTGLLFGW